MIRITSASSGSLTENVGSSAAPVISHLRVRVVHRKLRLTLVLSQAARLAVVISKLEAGRAVRGRCRPGAQHGRRCQTLRRRGILHLFAQAGRHSLRPHMRALAPGRYAVTLTAVGTNGKRSKRATVKVVVRQPTKPHAMARIATEMALLGLSLV